MSEYFVSNRNESVRMFRSDLMEKTTHVHPVVPHLIYIPLTIFLLGTSQMSIVGNVAWFVVGLFVWTLIEYVLHRYAFHAPHPVMEKVGSIISRHIRDHDVPRLVLVGGASAFYGFGEVVTEYTGVPAQVAEEPMFITPLGIAMQEG